VSYWGLDTPIARARNEIVERNGGRKTGILVSPLIVGPFATKVHESDAAHATSAGIWKNPIGGLVQPLLIHSPAGLVQPPQMTWAHHLSTKPLNTKKTFTLLSQK
jgi:hypothetical protein